MARVKLKYRTKENDIKYGGVLSYRHLRMLGWLFLAVAQVTIILTLVAKFDKANAEVIDKWKMGLSYVAALPLPLFFLANFSTMTHSRGNFKKLFIFYGGMALALYFISIFVVMHYGYRILHALNYEIKYSDAFDAFGDYLPSLGKSGYMLNMFIDMFLMTLLFYFINYEPKKVFVGKKKIIFRLFVFFPIAYEIGAIFIKYFVAMGNLHIKSYIFSLLPSKPPLIFLAFVFILFVLKIREVRFLKRDGATIEQWEEHITTKAHSFRTSITIAISFVIFALIDLAIYLILFLNIDTTIPEGATEYEIALIEYNFYYKLYAYENAGIGGAMVLILLAPIMLLFSYTKKPKNPKLDIVVPIAGIVITIFVIFEGLFIVITNNLGVILNEDIKTNVESFYRLFPPNSLNLSKAINFMCP